MAAGVMYLSSKEIEETTFKNSFYFITPCGLISVYVFFMELSFVIHPVLKIMLQNTTSVVIETLDWKKLTKAKDQSTTFYWPSGYIFIHKVYIFVGYRFMVMAK